MNKDKQQQETSGCACDKAIHVDALVIHEYCEDMEVKVKQLKPEDGERSRSVISDNTYKAHTEKRWVVQAFNEGGYNSTAVDILDLLRFVKHKLPELWASV